MKTKTKQLLLICLLLHIYVTTQAQSTYENQLKYWTYRDRLKYFVVVDPFDGYGTNIPFWYDAWDNINSIPKSGLTAGDGNDGLQYYIGFLATEYALLQQYGHNTTKTRNELLYALNAVERLDRIAEAQFRALKDVITPVDDNQFGFYLLKNDIPCMSDGQNLTDLKLLDATNIEVTDEDLNGFFIRDDIGSHFLDNWKDNPNYSQINNYKNVNSSFVVGNGRNMPYEMSKDNIWHYLVNFALVKILVDDAEIQQKLHCITIRMINSMKTESINGNSIWWIINPVTKLNVTDGCSVEEIYQNMNNIDGFNFGFAEAGRFITGKNLHYGTSIFKGPYFDLTMRKGYIYPKRAAHLMIGTVGLRNYSYFMSDSEMSELNNAIVPKLPLNNSFVDLQKIAKTLDFDYIDNDANDYESVMRILIDNIWHPDESEPATYEHLPLIRFLISKYQIKNNVNDNAIDYYHFLREISEPYYAQLLNEAPICGPKNYGPSTTRIANWSTANRLSLSHTITELDETGVVKINNANNFGTFAGIDYLLLHNLYWLCFIPKESITTTGTLTSNKNAGTITTNGEIKNSTNIVYTAANSITLDIGFSIELNSSFTANINNDWEHKIFNPATIISTNNCYSTSVPFIMNPHN